MSEQPPVNDWPPLVADFSCRVCGEECPSAPDPPDRAICEECCEYHIYDYQRDLIGHYCRYCGRKAPEDWFDE